MLRALFGSSFAFVLTLGCTEQKAPPPAEKAPAAKETAAVSAVPSVAAKKPATIAGVPVASFSLDDTKKLETALEPLGYQPIQGCGQATIKGRSVMCVYGWHAVTVSLHDKAPKAIEHGYEEGYTYPNSVLLSDGKHVIISAGSKGAVADADAVAKLLWDEKAKTFGGIKLRDVKQLGDLKAPLATKGYVGNVLGSIDYALRRLEIVTRHEDGTQPDGTFYDDGKGNSVSVKVFTVEGTVPPGEDKRILEALTK